MDGVGQGGYWLLRSMGFYRHYAACVYGSGGVFSNGDDVGMNGDKTSAVRPTFNLDLNSVLFTSVAGGSAQKAFGEAAVYAGSEWKVTLKDDNSFWDGAVVNKTSLAAGETLTITHKALNTFTNAGYTNVTAKLTNANDEIFCYGIHQQRHIGNRQHCHYPGEIACRNIYPLCLQ